MTDYAIRYLKFPINQWKHLYSLDQAILHSSEDTGRHLKIAGMCPSIDFLDEPKLNFDLTLVNVTSYPAYRKLHGGHLVLASLTYDEASNTLSGEMQLDNLVFEELRKNIIEYSLIDGIFIEATLGLRLPGVNKLTQDDRIEMIAFEYGMRS